MNRLAANRFWISGAKVLVAVILLLGMLATVVPVQSVSASTACRLACCAKRAPHAAGSCADGACHTSLKHNRRQSRLRATQDHGAELCGLSGKADKKTKSRLEAEPPPARDQSPQVEKAFGSPCPTECGGTLANSRTQRNAVAILSLPAASPIARSRAGFTSADQQPFQTAHRNCVPRGPPVVS